MNENPEDSNRVPVADLAVDALFGSYDRACEPEAGDLYRNYGKTVEILRVGEHLIDLRLTDETSGKQHHFSRNIMQWKESMRLTLQLGSVFLPNPRVSASRRGRADSAST